MTSFDDLEQKLAGLDLQFEQVGEHLVDERLAQITEGGDPTPAEAAHLAGCDECITLLTVLGEGMESLLNEDQDRLQPRVAGIRAPAGRRVSAPTMMAVMALAACAFAGVTWYLTRSPAPQENQTTQGDAQVRTQSPRSETTPVTPEKEPMKALPKSKAASEAPKAEQGEPTAAIGSAEPMEAKPAGEPTAAQVKVSDPVSAHPAKAELADSLDEKGPTTGIKEAEPTTVDQRKNAQAGVSKKAKSRIDTPKTRRPDRRARKTAKVSEDETSGKVRLSKKRLSGRTGPVPFTRKAVLASARGFGQLRVNSRPAAQVYVDGKLRGWTPIVDLRLQEGPHDIRLVYKSAHADRAEEKFRVMIKADQTWATVRDNRKKRSGK